MAKISTSRILASLLSENREDDALDLTRSLGADTPEMVIRLLDILDERGDARASLDLATSAVRSFPNHPEIASRHVRALMAEGRPGAAASTAEDFARRTGNTGLWAMQAEALYRAARFDEAGALLDRIMPLARPNAGAWLVTARLLWLHTIPDTARVLEGLDMHLADIELEFDIDHGRLHFARGLLREALGDLDGAWSSFRRGNDILGGATLADHDSETRVARATMDHIDAPWIADRHLSGAPVLRPVFLVGTAMSGVEDAYAMATRDARLGAAGMPGSLERDLHRACGATEGDDYVRCLSGLGRDDLVAIRERYLATIGHRIRGHDTFVDGLAGNIRHAGLIKAIFPDAVFVEIRSGGAREEILTLRAPLDPRAHPASTSLAGVRAGISARHALGDHWSGLMATDWAISDGRPATTRKCLEAVVPGWDRSGPASPLPGLTWPAPAPKALSRYGELMEA